MISQLIDVVNCQFICTKIDNFSEIAKDPVHDEHNVPSQSGSCLQNCVDQVQHDACRDLRPWYVASPVLGKPPPVRLQPASKSSLLSLTASGCIGETPRQGAQLQTHPLCLRQVRDVAEDAVARASAEDPRFKLNSVK
jgi:hypothetical protein